MNKLMLLAASTLISFTSFAGPTLGGISTAVANLHFNPHAKYFVYTDGPTHKIYLKIQTPNVPDKIIDLHKQAIIQSTADRTTIFTYQNKNQAYVFDTQPEQGEVSYTDLNLDWKELNGNLHCQGGFAESSFFVTSDKDGTVYLQVYCDTVQQGELYIRTFEGTDWTRRLPGQSIGTPKAITTDLNFYTFFIPKDANTLSYIDLHDHIFPLALLDNGAKITDVSKTQNARGQVSIKLTVTLADALTQKTIILNEGSSGQLSVMNPTAQVLP